MQTKAAAELEGRGTRHTMAKKQRHINQWTLLLAICSLSSYKWCWSVVPYFTIHLLLWSSAINIEISWIQFSCKHQLSGVIEDIQRYCFGRRLIFIRNSIKIMAKWRKFFLRIDRLYWRTSYTFYLKFPKFQNNSENFDKFQINVSKNPNRFFSVKIEPWENLMLELKSND